MPDFKFPIRDVARAYRYHAARRAVLVPLLNAKIDQGISTEDLADLLDRLRLKWRMLLVDLKEEGWAPAQGRAVQFLRNCPPFGVSTPQVAMPCHKATICPFCLGRRVIRQFQSFEPVIAGPSLVGLSLVHVTSEVSYPLAGTTREQQLEGLHKACVYVRSELENHGPRLELDAIKPEAALVHRRLNVWKDNQGKLKLMGMRNLVALVPTGQDLKADLAGMPRLVRIRTGTSSSRAKLAVLLGNAFRAGTGLWNHLKPWQLRAVLEEFDNFTATVQYGRLRNSIVENESEGEP